ncbi:cytochrome P450 78A3 [Rhizodiscina lignyota]|uniref:Cytochrome P450 78A3 n=1 Tax=Rhizodiscina lignyota TaxID=1504668 RepID=A0A9P4IAZ6_9PEZI|nr:cytochrome P450 78A3 [Rhizodiscina lignyota]
MMSLKRIALAGSVLAALFAALLEQRWALSRLTSIGLAVSLIIVQTSVIWCYHAFIYPRFVSPLRDIPMPPGASAWFGHTFMDIRKGKPQGTSLRKWPNSVPNDGIVRFLDLFRIEKLIPVSPAALADVLATKCYDFEKPEHFRSGSSGLILGHGILFAEGDLHKRQRKQLNPAFTFRHIKDLFPTYWKVSVDMLKAIEAQKDKETGISIVEPNDWSSRVTLDILGQAGLGRDFDALANPDNKVTKAYRDVFKQGITDILFQVAEVLISPTLVVHLPFERNRTLRKNMQTVRDVCAEIIQEKQQKPQADDVPTTDILSAILSSTTVDFTQNEMVEQLVTFLVAGHETTAAALAWAVFIICKHPDMQSRLREEVWAHLPKSAWEDRDAVVASSDFDAMPYLQAFCNEILRFYPPVPATMRHTAVDTTIAGHPVPKGTDLLLAPWAVNVSAALWGPDAGEFKPERWLESASGGCKSNYANLTFLHGPRSCIGQSFAKHEFVCLVGAWVGRFETKFNVVEGWKEPVVDMMSGISQRPTRGWKVEVKTIERD